MTKYELIKTNQGLLSTLVKNKIAPTEIRNIEIIEDYNHLREQNLKNEYIINVLMDKYSLSERTIYKIAERMSKQVIF